MTSFTATTASSRAKVQPHLRRTVEQVKADWLLKDQRPTGYLISLFRAMKAEGLPIIIQNVEDFCKQWEITERTFYRAKATLIKQGRLLEEVRGALRLRVVPDDQRRAASAPRMIVLPELPSTPESAPNLELDANPELDPFVGHDRTTTLDLAPSATFDIAPLDRFEIDRSDQRSVGRSDSAACETRAIGGSETDNPDIAAARSFDTPDTATTLSTASFGSEPASFGSEPASFGSETPLEPSQAAASEDSSTLSTSCSSLSQSPPSHPRTWREREREDREKAIVVDARLFDEDGDPIDPYREWLIRQADKLPRAVGIMDLWIQKNAKNRVLQKSFLKIHQFPAETIVPPPDAPSEKISEEEIKEVEEIQPPTEEEIRKGALARLKVKFNMPVHRKNAIAEAQQWGFIVTETGIEDPQELIPAEPREEGSSG